MLAQIIEILKAKYRLNGMTKSLNINWGIKKPIISKKDKLALSLEDFEKKRR